MDKRFISRVFELAHDRSRLAMLGLFVVLGCLNVLTVTPARALIGASEDFDYLDGDGYQPADSNPFDDPPTGTSPAFWIGQGEYRSSAAYGLIEEAPSGTNGITSANGSIGHAEFYPNYVAGFDTFHRNGGSSDGVPFTAPYSFKMDIYLDPAWTYRCLTGGCGAEDDFWINQGVNDNLPGPPNGNYLSEGSLRFNVTDIAPTDGTVEYSFHTGPGGPIGSLFQTTTPGWYTLEQIVNVGADGGDPGTDPDILFTHRIWNVQRTQILSNPNTFPSFNDANGAILGGDRYSSFYFVHSNITPFVAIDNVSVGPPLVQTLVVDDDGMASVGNCDDTTPCFSTIAAAITAANPGDIVMVCPGTYAENLVLAKSITLNGAQAGVDACGRVASESIITPGNPLIRLLELQTGSSGAIIDGFTFSGANRGIESTSGPTNNVQIRNNRFVGFTDQAVFLNRDGIDVTVHQNSINGASKTSAGGAFHLDTDNFDGFFFTDNCVESGPTGPGFFVDGNRNVGVSGTRAPLIDGNLFSGNDVGGNLGSRAFEFGAISDNTFTGNDFDGLQGGIQNTAITGNTFQSNGRWGLALTSFGSADTTRGARNCLITLNSFADNDSAGLFYSATQAPGLIATNVANNNNIAGNNLGGPGYGFIYRGSETVNVKCNWWGDILGPDHPTNPNPTADGIFAANPLFVPWLNAAAPGGSCDQYGTSNAVAANTTGLCISPSTPCVTVPVIFSRTDVTEARAASVTFQLSSNIELCGTPAASIAQGSWLGAWTNKTFLVVSNGGGSYTVDQAILGETPTPCGVTTGGTLFTVMVKKTLAAGDGSGTITVTDVDIRDCDNPAGVLPGIPGAPVSITIDATAPAGTSLTAVQDKTSNGTDGLTFIDVTVPVVGGSDSVRVRQKGFGNYPEYNDAPSAGSVPAIPATEAAAIAAGWTVAFTTAPGGGVTVSHQPPTRDFWYFVAFVQDPCGNVSGATSITSGNLNYHLGDVTPTGTPGDNDVDGLDISRLGSAYGFTLGPSDPFGDLDVGPTTDSSTNGRPTTDNLIGFEDLLMFALNFGTVSFNEPPAGLDDTPIGRPELVLATEPTADGVLVRVLLHNNPGTVKGIHALVDYDRDGLALVSVEEGTLLTRQGQPTFFRHLDEGAAGIHAALLGAGLGIHGSGEIARLRFRGRGAVELVHADLRDLENRFLGDPPATTAIDDGIPATAPAPERVELLAAQPNPFNPSTMLRFTLAAADQVTLRIYDVNGRLVRTLVEGVLPPGEHSAFWDGRSSQGAGAGSGVYVVRLMVGGRELTQKIQLLK